jgi:hypothetical protein
MLQKVCSLPPPSGQQGLSWRRVILLERSGVYCLIDAEDYDWISEFRWNIGWHAKTKWKFYAKRNVGRERLTVYLHREILMRMSGCTYEFAAAHHGHHKNGQSLDNRRANLEWLLPAQNSAIRVARHAIPTLDEIEARLVPEAGRLEEVPF